MEVKEEKLGKKKKRKQRKNEKRREGVAVDKDLVCVGGLST